MNIIDLAKELDVAPTELIKKLMNLQIMANLNYSLSYDLVELLVVDYNKTLKKEGTQDISNFEDYEKHGFYAILNSNIAGATQKEILLAAFACTCQNLTTLTWLRL